jgi:hypothetical protein
MPSWATPPTKRQIRVMYSAKKRFQEYGKPGDTGHICAFWSRARCAMARGSVAGSSCVCSFRINLLQCRVHKAHKIGSMVHIWVSCSCGLSYVTYARCILPLCCAQSALLGCRASVLPDFFFRRARTCVSIPFAFLMQSKHTLVNGSDNITFETCMSFVFVSIVWISELLKNGERLQGQNAIKKGAVGQKRCYSSVIIRYRSSFAT